VLGVGAGFPGISEPEFELVGVPFTTRFSHLDDVVTPSEVAATLARYVGVRHVLFRIAALEPDVLADQLVTLRAVMAYLRPEGAATRSTVS